MNYSVKKITATAAFLTAIFLNTAAYAADLFVYENASAGVKMNYPADWDKRENIGSLLVAFTSGKEDSNDNFQENLNVAVQNMTDETRFTLDEYTGAIISSYKEQLEDFNLLESAPATLVNFPASKIVYTAKNSDKVSLKLMMVLTIKDNKVYMVTFAAAEDKYEKFLPGAMTIVDSLETI